MTRPLADDELRDLLRAAYGPSRTNPIDARRTRPSLAWSVALLLIGAAGGLLARGAWSAPHAERTVARRDPVEAVQAAGSLYAAAIAELAAAPAGAADSAAIAREVVATSLLGVTRSLMTVVGGTPQTIGLYRLASELRQETTPAMRDPAGAEF